MVDSCHECSACALGEEQKCTRNVGTYQAQDWSGRAASYPPGAKTVGGYTSRMVVDERFGVLIPKSYPLEAAGPVLCSGITMYQPLKQYGAGGAPLRSALPAARGPPGAGMDVDVGVCVE